MKKLAIDGGKPVTDETIPIFIPYIDEEDVVTVSRAVSSTYVSGNGPECQAFERELEKRLGGGVHVLYTNSCTGALDLAYRIKRFPPNSTVLVPDFTFTSTALVPLLNNLRVKLVDVRPDNGNIDVDQIEAAITDDTVAISPVDYAGNPVEIDKIMKIAVKHDLYVVHDTAQSIGATYRGHQSGTWAHVSTFSFHGVKNMTTGEGGAFVTDNKQLCKQAEIMRDLGTDRNVKTADGNFYNFIDMGHSYIQSNINGALGLSQLDKLTWMNQYRDECAMYYKKHMKDIPNVKFPPVTEQAKTNWHLFNILVPPEGRGWIKRAINAEGVQCKEHYAPLHRNPIYSYLGTDEEFPGSVRFYNRLLRLPMYPGLSTDELDMVIEAVSKVMEAYNEKT